jgi:hypothetical protein
VRVREEEDDGSKVDVARCESERRRMKVKERVKKGGKEERENKRT